jgi:hypothetical protein
MKIRALFATLSVVLILFFSGRTMIFSSQKKIIAEANNEIRDGDIIFQTTESESSRAIALATHSQYTHCGLIYSENNKMYVMEAVQPVSSTPLDEFIKRGKEHHYVIKRIKDADSILTHDALSKMKSEEEKLKGKNYDIYFGWDDDKIYCSELVWKVYKRATGIELGKPEKLKDFDLTDPLVKNQLQHRYGKAIPYNEPVISPAQIFESDKLETVKTN